METLERKLGLCKKNVHELHDDVKMWQAKAAAAEETACAAVAAAAEATAAKAAMQRDVDKYRAFVEKARRMSGCKYMKSTFVMHPETLAIGVPLEVSVFDVKK